jgi:hypothetical protein
MSSYLGVSLGSWKPSMTGSLRIHGPKHLGPAGPSSSAMQDSTSRSMRSRASVGSTHGPSLEWAGWRWPLAAGVGWCGRLCASSSVEYYGCSLLGAGQLRLVLPLGAGDSVCRLRWLMPAWSPPREPPCRLGCGDEDSAVSLGPSLEWLALSGARELLGALLAYLGFFRCTEAMWKNSSTRLVWRRSASPSRLLSSYATASAARTFFSGVL